MDATAVIEKPKQITSRTDSRYEVMMYKYVGVKDSHTIEFYKSHGGYDTAKKVYTTLKPAEVIDEMKKSGLRGRGHLCRPWTDGSVLLFVTLTSLSLAPVKIDTCSRTTRINSSKD
jgi:hypothetical protein